MNLITFGLVPRQGIKYKKIFQWDNGSKFKSDVTFEFKRDVITLLEKHNADIQRATIKHKHTRKLAESLTSELTKTVV